MFKNYLSVALRSFMRNKVFTLINIAGLAIGISASLVIFLIVQYEFSYEDFLKNKDRIYRVVTTLHFPDMLIHNGGAPGPLHTAVEESIPGIENSTAFWMNYQMDV
ncbi:MAG: ABC transporter permease, partial [Saprospiraceae bacterium]|nr:ABC transporter permease [Saprospiraceae bacterium]